MGEIGASYRNDEFYGGDLDVRQWPVTASLYLTPIPSIYAGGGVGWYHTTFDYAEETGIPNSTSEEFGVHLGGGLQIPVAPMAAVDLSGRYVFMQDQESHLIPETFNPDFWRPRPAQVLTDVARRGRSGPAIHFQPSRTARP
jgi:opacity protein-like surface antigen